MGRCVYIYVSSHLPTVQCVLRRTETWSFVDMLRVTNYVPNALYYSMLLLKTAENVVIIC